MAMSADVSSPAELTSLPDDFPLQRGAEPAESDETAECFISRLPDELLCEIFCFLDHGDRIRCTQICRHWREASLGAPGLLWSDVQSQQCKPGVFAALMNRTRTVPIAVTVTITDENAEEVSSTLAAHLHHCQSLSLHIKEQLSDPNEALLGSALLFTAPLLEKFIVMDIFCSISSGLRDVVNLFGRHAPKLTCVKLYARAFAYLDVPAFSNVQQLLYAPYEGPFDFYHYQSCLRICPAMVDLSLQLRELDDAGAEDLWRLPSSLRSLSITPTSEFDPTAFLNRVSHISVPRINVLFLSEPSVEMTERVMRQLVANMHIVTMIVDAWEYDHLARLQLISDQGRILDLFDVHLCICPSVVASLTDLRMTEVEWLHMSDWPPLPALTSLTVYLVTVVYMVEHKDYDSILFSPGLPSRSPLACPQLRTLTFSTRRRGDTALLGYDPAIGSDTIVSFVTHQIRFQQRKIPRLVLNGLRLVPYATTTITSLLDLVQDIDYRPGHEQPPDLPSEELLHWV